MSSGPDDAEVAAERVTKLAYELEPYHVRYEAERDSRAVFAYTYANITHKLAEWLRDPEADVDSPGWVADLAVSFGEHYITAMDAIDEWERTHDADEAARETLYETVPRPWGDVYLAITPRRSTVLEDLIFGMGAHITYDLPKALVQVGTDPDRLGDYHRMNAVLASRTTAIKHAVTDRYNRVLGYLDRVVGQTDEVFTNYWIRVGRSVAWYNAMRLQSPYADAAAAGSIERSTAGLINSVRGGPLPLRLGSTVYRSAFYAKRQWPETPSAFVESD